MALCAPLLLHRERKNGSSFIVTFFHLLTKWTKNMRRERSYTMCQKPSLSLLVSSACIKRFYSFWRTYVTRNFRYMPGVMNSLNTASINPLWALQKAANAMNSL